MPRDREPWHRLLVDEENSDVLGDYSQAEVGPTAVIRSTLDLVSGPRDDVEPGDRLPFLASLEKSLRRLSPAVDAERAELVAETIGRDHSDPKPTQDEWDPDQPEDVGLPRRGEGDS